MYEPVHIHPSRLNRDINVILLFIPAFVLVIFATFLFIALSKNNLKEQVATTQEPSVLGEESQVIDQENLK